MERKLNWMTQLRSVAKRACTFFLWIWEACLVWHSRKTAGSLSHTREENKNALSQSRQISPSLPFLGFSAAFHPQSLPPTKFPWPSFDLTGYSHWFPGWFNLFSMNYDAEMLQGPLSPPFASTPLCFILTCLVTSFNNKLYANASQIYILP